MIKQPAIAALSVVLLGLSANAAEPIARDSGTVYQMVCTKLKPGVIKREYKALTERLFANVARETKARSQMTFETFGGQCDFVSFFELPEGLAGEQSHQLPASFAKLVTAWQRAAGDDFAAEMELWSDMIQSRTQIPVITVPTMTFDR